MKFFYIFEFSLRYDLCERNQQIHTETDKAMAKDKILHICLKNIKFFKIMVVTLISILLLYLKELAFLILIFIYFFVTDFIVSQTCLYNQVSYYGICK